MTGAPQNDEATRLIDTLALAPHPEGGYFRETWRDQPADGTRGTGTAIYYLLVAGEISAWHRVDATEIWHFYTGAALCLTLLDATGRREVTLGTDVTGGQISQAIIPAGTWQTATSLGDYSLVGCTVSPAFDFAGFELAPPEGPPES